MKQFKFISIILGAIIIVIFVGLGLVIHLSLKADTIRQAILQNKQVHYLLSFEFEDGQDERSIVSYLLLYSAKTGKTAILELPAHLGIYDAEADLMLPLRFYYKNYGRKRYIDAVRNLFKIDTLHSLYFPGKTLGDFVDLIGGLKVPLVGDLIKFQSIDGENEFGNYYSIFKQVIMLDGEDIVMFLSDIERNIYLQSIANFAISSRRKTFITVFLEQIKQERKIFEQKPYIKRISEIVDTDLSNDNIQTILLSMQNYNESTTYFQQISEAIGTITTLTIQDEDYEIALLKTEVGGMQEIFERLKNLIEREVKETEDPITLTILNGTVVHGLASSTRAIYQGKNMRVQRVGNAQSDAVPHTVVVDRVGNKEAAMQVADVIGAKIYLTDIAILDDASSEITLILGNDFNGQRVGQ